MNLSSAEMLRRLGSGQSIAAVCAAAGVERSTFDAWWRAETERRVPVMNGRRKSANGHSAEIVRDEWGIPHVLAADDGGLFYGFGYAMAQDRLFQLDYLRRRAWGRLSEVLGPEALQLDVTARTVGLGAIAQAEWEAANDETRRLLTAFSAGVNALIAETAGAPPIEFDLLDYRPEPWSPVDCLVIEGEFRWYLTGRLPIFAVPEMVRRTVGDGPLFQAFLRGEADEESILPAGSYAARPGQQRNSPAGGDPTPCQGSNNWVLAGHRTATGRPLLASDPHIAFGAVSCWYEAHLCGGSFNVTGMTYVGMPAVMFGRNAHVAWGCTNNICAQRDLYQERIDTAHPGCFLYDGHWEPARAREETIAVRGAAPVRKTIRSSRHGPIVDELLPEPTRGEAPVSLRWLGSEPCRWLESLLAMDRTTSAAQFRQATSEWYVPTFNVVFCDVDGHIGFQSVGRIPLRNVPERGFRPAWDAAHAWQGLIPFAAMPHLTDPERGFAITANNRVAPDDFPYPLAGVWASGYRARRIREMIQSQPRLSLDELKPMQLDILSLRAVACVPRLLAALPADGSALHQAALDALRQWNCRMEAESPAAAIFEIFFTHWSDAVARQRFQGEAAQLVALAAGGLAADLLAGDDASWFAAGRRLPAIGQAFAATLDTLSTRLGPNISDWRWGRLHQLQLRHVLSERGELAQLLDQPEQPVGGNALTVCNTGGDAQWRANLGGGYRMLVDMSVIPAEMWAIDAGGESGHPGSPNYADQSAEWVAGHYHRLSLDPAEVETAARNRLTFEP